MQIPTAILNDQTTNYNYESYANEVKNKLKQCHELARENLVKRKNSNKTQYDRTHSNEIKLKKNDLVLVLKNKKQHKFDDPYEGPYRVNRMLSAVTVQLKKGKKFIKVHLNKIKVVAADYGDDTPPAIQ